ncbi:Inorganic pyrophosphatase 2 [Hibiscus syriacus]|uniref:Inorganic pyrophosphatase 2 n=1 Tax=Hibiscus syriacus TaxID=106335 RepID=A0A6A3A544_HIBSY|nr:Inorganic pyrophosphatase 2 [Hibiscus syriacus]
MPWNSLMDTMMGEIHAQGKTIDDIVDVLKRTPIHPMTVAAIKSAHALGCELRIVSDANMFFIETILEHLGLKECFSEINSNPGFVNEEGRLRIFPYHDFIKCSHGCNLNLCAPNMCKGMIIERIQASLEGRKKIIYLGDGVGDYCPTLRLGKSDHMMPRKNFPVWVLICRNPMLIEAEIHGWSDGEDLEQVLLQLISVVSVDAQLFSVDCKLQTANCKPCRHPTIPCLNPCLFLSRSVMVC